MMARTWTGAVNQADATSTPSTFGKAASRSTARLRGTEVRGCRAVRRRSGPSSSRFRFGESEDAIRAFAGDDIEAAVLYPEDGRYPVGQSAVAHYQIVGEVSR